MDDKQAWIIVADRRNMDLCAQYGIYGLNHGAQLPKMKKGDHLIAYIKKETTFSGVGEVTKEFFLGDEKLFEGGLFPNRIGIKLDLRPEKDAISVWKLLDKMEFAKGKKQWQGILAGGTARISNQDFNTIRESLMETLAK